MQSPLAGAHNIQNLGVALGVLLALDVPLADAAAALSAAPPAPGRLERCHGAQDDVLAFVDYAHTPDALAQALGAVRRMVPGRLFCVFGCGGQRDETKRAPMGAVAARHADVVIVTNDNPRKEDPRRIAEQIVEGLEAAGAHSASREGIAAGERGYIVELDRPTAVELAAAWAQPRDGVLVAGKGHEAYQIVGDVKSPMDDRALVQSALEARRARMVARPTPR
jgi:UDP-N-acetylmuramoyl-L-alanyl-D-glutamate--2,6-diaminopimelate ligase